MERDLSPVALPAPPPAGAPPAEPAGEADRRLERLAELESAEELLTFFGIDFDPEALAPRRVRLLKRYGMSVQMIQRIPKPLPASERLRLHGEALQGQWDRLMLETTCASSYYAKRAGGCVACGTHVDHGAEAA